MAQSTTIYNTTNIGATQMPSKNHTPNFGLTQYAPNDRIALLDDYNSDMKKIDMKMNDFEIRIKNLEKRIGNA